MSAKLNKPDLKQALQDSANNRAVMVKRYGFIPLSILRIGRGALSKSMFQYVGEEISRNTRNDPKLQEKQEMLHNAGLKHGSVFPSRLGGMGSAARIDSIGLSVMPAELVQFFTLYYAKPGDVYLDPFMGQGIQMQVAKRLGLHYYGYDLSREFFTYIEAVRQKIDDGKTTISIHCADSRQPDQIPDGIGDFSFHSPPYWDIEYYGEDKDQLGTRHSYDEFLSGLQQVAAAWLPKFKPGAVHVVNVGDFRKKAVFYSYHSDTINVFKAAGWIHTDTWIIEGLVGGVSKAFAVSFNDRKFAPRVHEYALVFKCP